MAFHRKLSDISNTPSSCTIASHASHSADSVKHCYTAPPALTSILLTRSTNSTTNELSSAQSVHRAPLLTCAPETPRFCSRHIDWHSLCLAGPSRAAQPIQPERHHPACAPAPRQIAMWLTGQVSVWFDASRRFWPCLYAIGQLISCEGGGGLALWGCE